MSGLARDRTAEPASRDQILRRERGQGKMYFPAQVNTSRIAATIIIPVDAQSTERVCVTIPFILDVRRVDAPTEVTMEEGHTGFLRLPSAVLA